MITLGGLRGGDLKSYTINYAMSIYISIQMNKSNGNLSKETILPVLGDVYPLMTTLGRAKSFSKREFCLTHHVAFVPLESFR